MTLYNPECFAQVFKYPERWEEIKEAKLNGVGIGIEFADFRHFLMYVADVEYFLTKGKEQ